MKFLHATGSRPLEGYTIKRGLGRGGFGEVYYAVSEAGKDVALKLVRRNFDVELRGVGHCLNLKHPHLLALHDIKRDAEDNIWVVMEYIAGESLEDRLARAPQGLPPEEACQWARGAAAGLAYLHDHGIVHRDLKPGNVFVDEGIVKLGDYGLSKYISCGRRSGQTDSVGTVHYMAPEVANGRYGKQIDIYALGVLIHETLTGRAPFEGESVGEVLMKHLTATPDLTALVEPYRSVVGRAMAKDPEARFESVEAMVDRLPSFAGTRPLTFAHGSPTPRASLVARENPARRENPTLGASLALLANSSPASKSPRERMADLLGAMLFAAGVAVVTGVLLLLARGVPPEPQQFAWLWMVATLGSWCVMVPAKAWEGALGDITLRRFAMLVIGLAFGIATWGLHRILFVELPGDSRFVIDSGVFARSWINLSLIDGRPSVWTFAIYFGLLFAVPRWWRQADPARLRRVSLGSVARAVLAAWLLNMLCPFPQPWGLMVAAAISLTTQLASPLEPLDVGEPIDGKRTRRALPHGARGRDARKEIR